MLSINPIEYGQFDICMYTPSGYGGHARYTHEVLSALSEVGRDKGVRVSLVTSRNLGPDYRIGLYPIYDILPPLRPSNTFRNAISWGCSRVVHYFNREMTFLRWIKSSPCEGVHFQEYTPWLAPRHFRLLKAWGKRLFFTVHNIYPHKYPAGMPKAFYPIYNSWNRAAWRLCDALFVHTDDLREHLSAFLGEGHPPIFVVPHGVWGYPGSAAVSSEERVLRRHLLFFGVIRPNKGLHILLRAMERLTDCTLTVAGVPQEPRYQEQIRTLVKQLPPDRVELIERFVEEDEVVRLFDRSSLVVLPYTSFAAQSGVLHEALAFGLPVVATDVGALGKSVRHWSIGQVVPPNDDAALAAAIREILTPRRYVEAGRAVGRVRDDLSWTRAAEATIEAYLSVWPKTGASAP